MVTEFPENTDGDVLRRLRADGDSLTQPRGIDFTVIFPHRAAADTVAKLYRDQGCEIELRRSGVDRARPWDLTITREMVPEYQAIKAFECELAQVAQPLGGRNDGWGCFTLRDIPPSDSGNG